jgi:hypothetical protein
LDFVVQLFIELNVRLAGWVVEMDEVGGCKWIEPLAH